MRISILAVLCSVICAFSFLGYANDTYPVTASDKKYFSQIRTALSRDDFDWLSQALCSYPFTVNLGNDRLKIRNKKDLKKYGKTVFNSALKSDVLNQSSESLFKNWQGIMIGNGDIWFSELGEKSGTNIVWRYQIIGINVPSVQLKSGHGSIHDSRQKI